MLNARPTADMVGICVVEFVLPILHTSPIFSTTAGELSGRSDSNAPLIRATAHAIVQENLLQLETRLAVSSSGMCIRAYCHPFNYTAQ